MVSLETRAIGAAALSVLVAIALFALVELTIGFPAEWANLAGFLIVAGLAIGAPQLYLATADDSVSATSRFGFVLVALLIIGSLSSESATTAEQIAIWSLIGMTVLGMSVHQIRAGYRLSTGEKTGNSADDA